MPDHVLALRERQSGGGALRERGQVSTKYPMVVFTLDLMSTIDNGDFKELN